MLVIINPLVLVYLKGEEVKWHIDLSHSIINSAIKIFMRVSRIQLNNIY